MRPYIVAALALALAGPSLAHPPAALRPTTPVPSRHPGKVQPSTVTSMTLDVLQPTRRLTLASRGLAFDGARLRQVGGTRDIGATRAFLHPERGTATLVFAHLIPAGRYTLSTRYRVVDAHAPAPACLPWASTPATPAMRCVGPAVEFAREPAAAGAPSSS